MGGRLLFCGFVASLATALAMAQDFDGLREMHAAFTSELQLGIDLGTTQSVAAICAQGNVSVVRIEGDYLVPSVVSFGAARTHVGKRAVEQKQTSGDGEGDAVVVYAAKRIIGTRFASVESARALDLPMALAADHNGNVGFQLSDDRVVSPELVSSLVLKKLKAAAERSSVMDWVRRSMGFKFKAVTVTVPVTFTAEQKHATVKASRMAGFRQVRLIEEPVAAALAYGLGSGNTSGRVLVFDFGGGTLDIAMLYFNAYSGSFYVDATDGEPRLGGEDFDRAIAELLLASVDAALRDPIRASTAAWQRLLVASERAKRELTDHEATSVCMSHLVAPATAGECTARVRISQADLRSAALHLFAPAMAAVERVLRETDTHNHDAIDVVLVGGTSRIPALRSDLQAVLPNATLHFDNIDPDQAIAIGAAKSWGCN